MSSGSEAFSNKYFPSSPDKNSKRSAFSNKRDNDIERQNYTAINQPDDKPFYYWISYNTFN
jgi:hypothetical protein